MPGFARHSSIRHLLAVAAGLLVGMLVFFYTGDSDLIFALGSGVTAICLVYLVGHLHSQRRPSISAKDPGILTASFGGNVNVPGPPYVTSR